MKKATASDVARACGVSQATVSYVLNNRPDKSISENTRKKILDTARELCYFPDISARNMRTQRSMSIGIVVNQDSINLSFHQVLKGIKEVLYQNGYSITLLPDDEPSDRARYVSYFLSRRIDGILFLYITLDPVATELLEKHHIPYMTINEAGIRGCGVVLHTGIQRVIAQCVEYCQKNHLERAAYICYRSRNEIPTVMRKYTLLKKEFEKRMTSCILEEYVIDRNEDDENLRAQIDKIIELHAPQIIFTPLPRLTLLIQSCILRGNFNPEWKIKMISLYDSHFFDSIYPSITHLTFPLSEMGAYACQCLIQYFFWTEGRRKNLFL